MMELQGERTFGSLPPDQQASWKERYAELLVTACREDAWPQAVLDCATAASDQPSLERCGHGLDQAMQEKMGARVQPFLAAMIEDVRRSQASAVPLGDPSLSAWTSGETAIAACDGYVFVIEAFTSCDRLPPESREMGRKTLATMKQGWRRFRDPNTPAGERRAAADTCHEEMQDMRAAALAAGCPIPEAPPPALVPAPEPAARTKKKAKK